jgi:hypothetical protein
MRAENKKGRRKATIEHTLLLPQNGDTGSDFACSIIQERFDIVAAIEVRTSPFQGFSWRIIDLRSQAMDSTPFPLHLNPKPRGDSDIGRVGRLLLYLGADHHSLNAID